MSDAEVRTQSDSASQQSPLIKLYENVRKAVSRGHHLTNISLTPKIDSVYPSIIINYEVSVLCFGHDLPRVRQRPPILRMGFLI